jgi:hypothetical protein
VDSGPASRGKPVVVGRLKALAGINARRTAHDIGIAAKN